MGGPGIEIDSALYLGVAENILGGEGITTPGGGKFLLWPRRRVAAGRSL